MAGAAPPGYSSGGMVTKLAAARIAMQAGCAMLIAEGDPRAAMHARHRARSRRSRPARARRLFLPGGEPRSARKAWIAGAVNPAGALVVDDGAARALRGGKSLLPAGVVAVEGAFERGDCVIVRTRAGAEAGRGLSAYASADIRRIAGHKSGEIADNSRLPWPRRDHSPRRSGGDRQAMTTETLTPRREPHRRRSRRDDGRDRAARARGRGGAGAGSRPTPRSRRCGRPPPRCARRPTRSSPPMPTISPRRRRAGIGAALARPAGARPEAARSGREGARGHRRAARSGRPGAGRMDPARTGSRSRGSACRSGSSASSTRAART